MEEEERKRMKTFIANELKKAKIEARRVGISEELFNKLTKKYDLWNDPEYEKILEDIPQKINDLVIKKWFDLDIVESIAWTLNEAGWLNYYYRLDDIEKDYKKMKEKIYQDDKKAYDYIVTQRAKDLNAKLETIKKELLKVAIEKGEDGKYKYLKENEIYAEFLRREGEMMQRKKPVIGRREPIKREEPTSWQKPVRSVKVKEPPSWQKPSPRKKSPRKLIGIKS